jgi:hypothetical protein
MNRVQYLRIIRFNLVLVTVSKDTPTFYLRLGDIECYGSVKRHREFPLDMIPLLIFNKIRMSQRLILVQKRNKQISSLRIQAWGILD